MNTFLTLFNYFLKFIYQYTKINTWIKTYYLFKRTILILLGMIKYETIIRSNKGNTKIVLTTMAAAGSSTCRNLILSIDNKSFKLNGPFEENNVYNFAINLNELPNKIGLQLDNGLIWGDQSGYFDTIQFSNDYENKIFFLRSNINNREKQNFEYFDVSKDLKNNNDIDLCVLMKHTC